MLDQNNRFIFKILGVFTVEIVKVTPKEVRKTLWQAALILFIVIVLIRLPSYIDSLRWWQIK